MADLLVVDDDPDTAEALADLMRLDGHEVRIAYNGEHGLRLLAERMPDLVLLDVEMPVLTGPGMAHRMFLHDVGLEKIPILLISGIADLGHVAREVVGTPYFLMKPYRYEHLVAAVASALSGRVPPNPGLPKGGG